MSLEQQGRMKLTGESLEQQIAETYAGTPERAAKRRSGAKRLGALNEQKEDIESAIAWYQYAADLTNGSDAGLVRRVSDLKMRSSEQQISEQEAFLPARLRMRAVCREAPAELEEAREKRPEILIDEARKRVERNPTDLQFRFELGEHLMNAGQYPRGSPRIAARPPESQRAVEGDESSRALLSRTRDARPRNEAARGSRQGDSRRWTR